MLDSGDMFTGTLSRLTEGEALLEMMTVMRYDAMGVGDHEFDYGWQAFERGITRVPASRRSAATSATRRTASASAGPAPCSSETAYTWVIGVIGLKAAHRTIMPSRRSPSSFTDPAAETAAWRDAPARGGRSSAWCSPTRGCRTDADRRGERPGRAAATRRGPGVLRGGARHRRVHRRPFAPRPQQAIVHPDTRTLVTQTYGYGTRLGRIRLKVRDRTVTAHDVSLLKAWSDELPRIRRHGARRALPGEGRGIRDRSAEGPRRRTVHPQVPTRVVARRGVRRRHAGAGGAGRRHHQRRRPSRGSAGRRAR